jgi:hypothetical protein
MAFKGKYRNFSKIVLNNAILQQVTDFSYLGCGVTYGYDDDDDVNRNMKRIRNNSGTISGTLRKHTKQKVLKFYKVIDLPTVVHSSES